MKRLKHIINWTIWSLLGTYVALVLLIQLPFVQRWIGSAVASAVGSKLGTEVSVGRVDLGFFNRLIIDDVAISDQQGQPLLTARRMAVKIDLLPLLSGRVSISSAQLFGTTATLYRDSAGAVPNYQFVLDALKGEKKDEPSRLDLHIGSLIARQMTVSYDQRDAPKTPGRFNPRHIKVSDVSAHILLRTLTTDSLNINIKRIAMREQSGIDLQRLSLKLEGNRQTALLTDLAIELPDNSLSIDSVRANYDMSDLSGSLHYGVKGLRAALTYDEWPTVDIAGDDINGTLHSIACQSLKAATPDSTFVLHADGSIDGDIWLANVKRLYVAESLLQRMHSNIDAAPEVITRLGDVSMTMTATVDDFGDISARGNAATQAGQIAWQGNITTDGSSWTAHVNTDSLHLGRLTANGDVGMLTARLDIHSQNNSISVSGSVPRIDFKGYSYRNLDIDGTYSPAAIAGRLKIDDPNLKANVEGRFVKPARGGRFELRGTGTISNMAPQALHLSDHWGDAAFAAVIDVDMAASRLTDAQGTIDLDDFIMLQGDTTRYHLDNLHLRTATDDERNTVRLGSEFGEVLIDGHFNLATLPQTFASLLPVDGKEKKKDTKAKNDNDFTLYMRMSDSEWMQKLLGIQLDLNGPLTIEATVNDAEQQLMMKADMPSFTYGSTDFHNASLMIERTGDSTQCHASATRMSAKGTPLYINFDAHTQQSEIVSAIALADDGTNGGMVNSRTRIYDNDEGKREVHARIMPSQLVIKNNVWELEPCDILYSDKRLMVDHFTLHRPMTATSSDEQPSTITIDGIASTLQRDTLIVDMQNVDVATLLEALNFRSVRFGGTATGQVYASNAFSTPEAWADIDVSDMLFQNARMGQLEAHAEWNNSDKQIDIDAVIDNGADSQTYIDGSISPARKDIDLGIRARGTSIGFVQSFTKSFTTEMEGRANGDVHIFGPLKKINMEGDVAVSGKTTVKPLGTTYTFTDDTVHLEPGIIGFRAFNVYDRDGHSGALNGNISHTHFKDINFLLTLNANNLLAYDFPQLTAGSTIAGTVWADGTAHMRGKPGEVVIDCDVTPTGNSVFLYNASSPDAISQQQFITWGAENNTTEAKEATAQKDNTKQNTPAKVAGDLHLNLRINANDDASLRLLMDQQSEDYIVLHGNGVLRAAYYNKGPFQMFGTYAVERGTYSMTIQNILKKNFQFQPGSSIVFGGDPFQAALNLKAVHTVNGVSLSDLGLGNSFTSNTIRVNCLMNILGTAGEPRVEFDLEMPTVNSEEQQMIRSIIASEQELNQQVVYLLGIGRFYTQSSNNAATQSYGQTELAMQSLLSGTVSSQINQLLSQVIKNDEWNFGANISTGNEGWHNAEYEGLVSGRMLNNRLLLNGQFGYRDNATQATPSFIGDFDLQYLLTPNGGLSLKAYNKTNDRYFTHSSLNTQGVGIIMKKDFNGLKDLFGVKSRKRGISE